MSFDSELSQLEAVVSECEKDIQDGTFDADAIVSQICSIADPKAKIAKGGEWIAQLMEKLNKLNILRLNELMHQHPHTPRIKELGHRVVNCYLALHDINASISENLVSPDMKVGVQAENQKMRDKIERLFGGLFS